MKTASTHKKWLPNHGQWVHFTHRDVLRRNRPTRIKASLPAAVPATALPVDCTGNAAVSCPMLANDRYGDCGPVMCAHSDQIRTFGQGKAGFTEVVVNEAALVSQYEQYSGGDNGTDEAMLVGPGGLWLVGVAGDSTQTVVDHLDVDLTNPALAAFCHDQFYGICMAWSVPDAFLNGFAQGTVWTGAATPNPQNGHYTPLSDIDASGKYRCWTWGAWCWMDQAYVNSVDPECFVTFSALQFSKATGYDSHGRHVGDVAAAWVSIGGNASIVQQVVAQFPPKAQPPAPPSPTPTSSPTLAQAQAAVAAALGGGAALVTKQQALDEANAGLAKLYGSP